MGEVLAPLRVAVLAVVVVLEVEALVAVVPVEAGKTNSSYLDFFL